MMEYPLEAWKSLLDRFSSARVLVVGDLMLDVYLKGDVTRISPEAPVPIAEIYEEEHRLGGAANVAANLASLGVQCELFGVIGEDLNGAELEKYCQVRNIDTSGVVTDPSRPTTTKTRVLARTQQLIRLDRERRDPLSRPLYEQLLQRLLDRIEEANAVIIEDYGKGVITRELIAALAQAARRCQVPVVVDPNVGNFPHYQGVTCITPNTQEAAGGAGLPIRRPEELVSVGRTLLSRLELELLLITRGPEGMSLFERNGSQIQVSHIPTAAQEVYDVTGAGDTVTAVFTTALSLGAPPLIAARLSNYAAGCVIRHLGCATTTTEELWNVLVSRAEREAALIFQEHHRLYEL